MAEQLLNELQRHAALQERGRHRVAQEVGVHAFGWSLDKPGRCNWIWDVLIAYNVGQSVAQRPLLLITGDEHFHEVAMRTGHDGLVLRLVDYRLALRVR